MGNNHNLNLFLWLVPTVLCGSLLLTACTSYQARSLEDHPPLALSLSELRGVAAHGLLTDAVSDGGINLEDGLDLSELATLAVINNPELRSQRMKWQLASAQVFSAGLLPDPQLTVGIDKPTGNNTGLVNPWLVDLGYDIVPLITRRARLGAAQKGQEKVYLDLLWQEWQVIQQTRSLAVRLQFEKQQLVLLRDMRTLYQDRYQRSAKALQDGDITLDVNGTDLTALVDTLSQINQLKQRHNETRHSLSLLLGLDPQVDITMTALGEPLDIEPETVKSRLHDLPNLRPDLLALKAGYASQEESVRAAILAQFPSIGIGINRANDSSAIKTSGLSISLSLPLFNGNRGNIAIERATRDQLRYEYSARLASATMDVAQMLSLQAILRDQHSNLQTYMPNLNTLVERARRAYRQGDIQALTFLNMESTWVNKQLEQINLTRAMWENRIALETLLAMPGYPQESIARPDDMKETNS